MMQVRTLVEAGATIHRITEVKPGDIYKRLDKPSYGDARIVFGQILDVLNDGVSIAISAVEFYPSAWGSSFDPTIKAFAPDTDVSIYPATEEEWRTGLAEAIKKQSQAVDTVQRDLNSKQAVLDMLGHVAEHGVEQPTLRLISGPAFPSISVTEE